MPETSDKAELARRGEELYEREIALHLTDENKGDVVAIDVESGEYAVAENELTASDRLLERQPDARIWFRRVGSRYLFRLGPRRHD